MCQSAAMVNDGVKEMIKAKALAHGFALCRISSPVVDQKHVQGLQHWVQSDMQADMAWMAEEVRMQRRMQPESMLQDVRSVITVAMTYSPPAYQLDEANEATEQGVISAYAHGDDYHDVMKKRLKALAADLDVLLGKHDQRVFVDTAPVLEHALAESSGLGWQGKHSLTIHRELGSWFLLGEIFTTAEIDADEAANNHCGTCSACLDVCPTQAIVAPYVVDARLCISYLTIEFDGFIPHPLRSLMGNHIYGCDDCQMVCPWNQHAAKVVLRLQDLNTWCDPLTPRGENHLPNLASLLRLDDDGFRQLFRKSPIKRTKRAGLLRNVCIAMGNSGNDLFVDDLLPALTDKEALVRGHAAWALGRLSCAENHQCISAALQHQLVDEVDVNAREEIILTIEYLRSKYDDA
ncbi:tRNA epoxyqueuosine(34) reductase QueG [Mariprofundus sp. EBB-1]|nr:tRNA epoxyqueuosine(34) reductase QueG [Mariprofundus sp. EBB-1]